MFYFVFQKKGIALIIGITFMLFIAVVGGIALFKWSNDFRSKFESQIVPSKSIKILFLEKDFLKIRNFNEIPIVYSNIKIENFSCNINGTLQSNSIVAINISNCIKDISPGYKLAKIYTSNSIISNLIEIKEKKKCIGPDSSIIPHGENKTYWFEQQTTGICINETRVCNDGVLSGNYQYSSCQNKFESCKQIFDLGLSTGDGTYTIYPQGYSTSSFQVYCDMTNGGWTYIVGNPLYNSGNLPLEPTLIGRSISYPNGDFLAYQGYSVSGYCNIPQPTYSVIIRFNHSQIYAYGYFDWYNSPPQDLIFFDINYDGSKEAIKHTTAAYGSGAYSLSYTTTNSQLTRVWMNSNSCQNDGNNRLQVYEIRVK